MKKSKQTYLILFSLVYPDLFNHGLFFMQYVILESFWA